MTQDGSASVVLVVEDQRKLADLFSLWLSDHYEVRTAYTGEQALELLDDSVAVVVLDRRLPGLSGDEFLDRVTEEGYDLGVAVVSAVEPDFDILDMGFDEYVTKPVEREDLLAVVQRLLGMDATGQETRDYFALVSKKEALETEKTRNELAESEEYAELLVELATFRNRVVSLAEQCLDTPRAGGRGVEKRVYQQEIEAWEERKRSLNEADPLYRTAEREIEKYRSMLADEQPEADAERELLAVVAEGFVAEGFWLDGRVLRALNLVLFDKYSDVFVVQRQPLEEGVDLEGQKLVDLSAAVRDLAAEELSRR
jgi:DNA-binding response OmpR family regulator